jgi:hypothetical protein
LLLATTSSITKAAFTGVSLACTSEEACLNKSMISFCDFVDDNGVGAVSIEELSIVFVDKVNCGLV